jgi:chorismate lyase/3-hydroxybenzoate synthase
MSANTQASYDSPALQHAARQPALPPQWVFELLSDPQTSAKSASDFEIVESGPFALIRATIPYVTSMDAPTLEQRVADTYTAILHSVDSLPARHPVRLWNYIPAIHQPMEHDRDRYMVFNAGRYRAFNARFGGHGALDRMVTTPSGIGHDRHDLVIHCLSTAAPAIAIDNPRQIPPHRYSARYGPFPPCFARATLLPQQKRILIGGTASIKGEESLHTASLSLQFQETLTNLASVVEAAHMKSGAIDRRTEKQWLSAYTELRVYYARAADGDTLAAMTQMAFSNRCRIEMRRADLCRSELLVEIEGVAIEIEGVASLNA